MRITGGGKISQLLKKKDCPTNYTFCDTGCIKLYYMLCVVYPREVL